MFSITEMEIILTIQNSIIGDLLFSCRMAKIGFSFLLFFVTFSENSIFLTRMPCNDIVSELNTFYTGA